MAAASCNAVTREIANFFDYPCFYAILPVFRNLSKSLVTSLQPYITRVYVVTKDVTVRYKTRLLDASVTSVTIVVFVL